MYDLESTVKPDEENQTQADIGAQKPCCFIETSGRSLETFIVPSYWAFILAALLPVCAMFIPLFLVERIREISTTGILGEALRTSTRLVIAESISIGCTLPVLSDMFVDRVTSPGSRIAATSLSMRHRLLFLVVFSLVSVLYLSLNDCYFMAFLYIVLNRSKV